MIFPFDNLFEGIDKSVVSDINTCLNCKADYYGCSASDMLFAFSVARQMHSLSHPIDCLPLFDADDINLLADLYSSDMCDGCAMVDAFCNIIATDL